MTNGRREARAEEAEARERPDRSMLVAGGVEKPFTCLVWLVRECVWEGAYAVCERATTFL